MRIRSEVLLGLLVTGAGLLMPADCLADPTATIDTPMNGAGFGHGDTFPTVEGTCSEWGGEHQGEGQQHVRSERRANHKLTRRGHDDQSRHRNVLI